MADKFTITVDVPRDLVRITMSGFFGEGDVLAFLGERMAAHRQLKCAPNQHVTLNDMRAMDVRSQGVVDSFRSILASPDYRSRRLAFVVTGALSRMQLMRTIEGRNAQVFEDPAAAEAWLLSADDAEAA